MAIQGVINQVAKLKGRGLHHIVAQELENVLINKWSKPKTHGKLVFGVDKRLLNISKLDGGYGMVIKGKMPVRAKIILSNAELGNTAG